MPRAQRLMPDAVTTRPIGQIPELFPDRRAAFGVIEVRPRQDDGGYSMPDRPVMPLLTRGQCLEDALGEVHTVVRVMVRCQTEPYGARYYWYEYTVINGARALD